MTMRLSKMIEHRARLDQFLVATMSPSKVITHLDQSLEPDSLMPARFLSVLVSHIQYLEYLPTENLCQVPVRVRPLIVPIRRFVATYRRARVLRYRRIFTLAKSMLQTPRMRKSMRTRLGYPLCRKCRRPRIRRTTRVFLRSSSAILHSSTRMCPVFLTVTSLRTRTTTFGRTTCRRVAQLFPPCSSTWRQRCAC